MTVDTQDFGANVLARPGQKCGCCQKVNQEFSPAKIFFDSKEKEKFLVLCPECVISISGKEWDPDPTDKLGLDEEIDLKGLYARYVAATPEWERFSEDIWVEFLRNTKGIRIDENNMVKRVCAMNPNTFIPMKIKELLASGVNAYDIGKTIRCQSSVVLKYSESFTGRHLHPARIEEICKLLKTVKVHEEEEMVEETEEKEEVINPKAEENTAHQNIRNLGDTITEGQELAVKTLLKNFITPMPMPFSMVAKKIKLWDVFPDILSSKSSPQALGVAMSSIFNKRKLDCGWEVATISITSPKSGRMWKGSGLRRISVTPMPYSPPKGEELPSEVKVSVTVAKITVYVKKRKEHPNIPVEVIWEE